MYSYPMNFKAKENKINLATKNIKCKAHKVKKDS